MCFVQGETNFYVVRVLLGAAEAGFFPGIIFYLTLWFPAVYRARIVGWFMVAIPAPNRSGRTGVQRAVGLGWCCGSHGLAMVVHS